jgi:hypothetical protein
MGATLCRTDAKVAAAKILKVDRAAAGQNDNPAAAAKLSKLRRQHHGPPRASSGATSPKTDDAKATNAAPSTH